MPYSTPLMLTSIARSQILDYEAIKRRTRHDACIVDHDVDASEGLHGAIDQLLHLIVVGNIRRDGERLAAPGGEFVHE